MKGRDGMRKKAILLVSFGSSHPDAMEKTILVLQKQIADTYPEYRVYLALTSKKILKKLESKGLFYDCLETAMERMQIDGMESVVIQPTHIIYGTEYERLVQEIETYRDGFTSLKIGSPLLSTPEDYKKVIHAIIEEVHLEEDECLLLMGHGTEHYAHTSYPALEYMFHTLGYEHVYVGTMEGFPGLPEILHKFKAKQVKRVVLFPFLFVPGKHVKDDMVGAENSWKCQLLEAGYEVRAVMMGLGEIKGVRRLLIEHMEGEL